MHCLLAAIMTEGEEEAAMEGVSSKLLSASPSLTLPSLLHPLPLSLSVSQLRGVLAHIIVLGFDILFLFCNTFVMLVLSSLLLLLFSLIFFSSYVLLWQRHLAEASSFLELRSVNCN